MFFIIKVELFSQKLLFATQVLPQISCSFHCVDCKIKSKWTPFTFNKHFQETIPTWILMECFNWEVCEISGLHIKLYNVDKVVSYK